MIKAIAAAFAALCVSASTLGDMTLAGRYANAAQSLMPLKCSLKRDAARTVVPDLLYLEGKALYLKARSSVAVTKRGPPATAAQGRRYATRKTLTIAQAAAITGLGRSTIKRLDKDPGNTNYPGRNATAKILAAWAQLRREGKIAVRAVRAANRPALGLIRS